MQSRYVAFRANDFDAVCDGFVFHQPEAIREMIDSGTLIAFE